MQVALTGASGLVGTYTAAALKARGHRIRALARRTTRRDHLDKLVDEWILGDHTDPQSLAGLVAGAEAVIHAAVDWDALEESPLSNFHRNLLSSLRLLDASRLAGVEQFIFVSSCAVYHEILQDRPLDETHPTWPDSIYGAYKAAVEPHLKSYHTTYGMNTSSWRPVAIYGVAPRVEQSQWFNLVKAAKAGQTISTAQGGKIVHVQDVADALALAVGDAQVAGQFYNLVDRHMYWQVAAEMARDLSGSRAVIEDRKGTGPKNQFDTRKAIAFFDRHGNQTALRRGLDGVRQYIQDLLPHC